MKYSNSLGNAIDVASDKAKYDSQVKKILSDKKILAWILKYSTEEFKSYTIEDIIDCIEGTLEISEVPIHPGKEKTETITGLITEDKVPNEGEIAYDIRFSAVTKGEIRVKLIINIEAQKKYEPGYDIVTRALFYCSRMISAQLGTEFVKSNYDDIKKVYSIWICMDVPQYAENTIVEYSVSPKNLYGQFKGKTRYDILSAIIICLDKENHLNYGSELHSLMNTLLSGKLTPKEKKKMLQSKFHIATSYELEEGMNVMCNLSDLVEERGIEKGIIKGKEMGIRAIITFGMKYHISKEEIIFNIMEEYKLTKEEAAAYFEM